MASLRLLKLLEADTAFKYFYTYDEQSRKKQSSSLVRTLFILYYFSAFMHFFSCVWLMVGRMDWSRDTAGWFKMNNFDKNPSYLEQYVDSLFFAITTLGGAGFGNVVPSTNLEWGIDTIFNLIGCPLFMCIFVDFV